MRHASRVRLDVVYLFARLAARQCREVVLLVTQPGLLPAPWLVFY